MNTCIISTFSCSFMSADEMLQWDKDNGCIDQVYSMESMG